MTIEEIQRARRDLEKRLLIDLKQFEMDTGLIVDGLDIQFVQSVGQQRRLTYVEVKLEIPR